MDLNGDGLSGHGLKLPRKDGKTGRDKEIGFTRHNCFEAKLFKEKDLSFCSNLEILMA